MGRSRFVILKHTQPASQIPFDRRQYLGGVDLIANDLDVHYDLMLESNGGLVTWALPKKPLANGSKMPAIQLPVHRAVYLDYEGPVSKERGSVQRVMAGAFELLEVSPPSSLEGCFEKVTIELFPDDQGQPLQLLLLERLEPIEQEKFQLTCFPHPDA